MKKRMLILFLSIVANGVAVFAKNGTNRQVDSLLVFAQQYIGRPYKMGVSGPGSFDCSGFTKHVFAKFGYHLNRISADQVNNGITIKKMKDARKGDLIFFKGSNALSSSIGHVGIVISDYRENPVRFIHASTSSGVRIDRLDDAYFNKRFISLSRVINMEDEMNDITENPAFYTVKKGDTLYSLSRKYNCSVEDIKEWNRLVNNDLQIGQQLSLKDTSIEKNIHVPENRNTHVVKKGETLYRIAKNNNCSVNDLKKWNNLNGNSISVGQTLKLKNSF